MAIFCWVMFLVFATIVATSFVNLAIILDPSLDLADATDGIDDMLLEQSVRVLLLQSIP